MIKIEKDIEEIKKTLSDICYVLGIGKVTPAKVIDLKRQAVKIAGRLCHGNKKKD